MPRVTHVKRARKPNSLVTMEDIESARKNEEGQASYYWWKFRYGGKRMSKTYPKQSQLTQSEFLGFLYDMQDTIGEVEVSDPEDLESLRDEWVDEIRSNGEEQRDKHSNMPDSLQYSPTGELLEQRADGMEEWASELENIDVSYDEEDLDIDEDVEDKEQALLEAKSAWISEKLDELRNAEYSGE